MVENNTVIFYHANCDDGFSSSMVAWLKLKGHATIIPSVHGHFPSSEEINKLKGKYVYFCDFCHNRDIMGKIAKVCKRLVILDHHISAKNMMKNFSEEFSNVEMIFSGEYSGVGVAYQYFFNSSPNNMPLLFKHIQDNDLWEFKLPRTKEVIIALRSYPQDYIIWNKFIDKTGVNELYEEGKFLLKYYNGLIEKIMLQPPIYKNIGDYNVPVLNVPRFLSSDVANELCSNKPFAATYYDNFEERIYSLRSDKIGVDVSKIASIYGGGGHFHAAGFSIKKNQTDI